jgi:hypothetical protein
MSQQCFESVIGSRPNVCVDVSDEGVQAFEVRRLALQEGTNTSGVESVSLGVFDDRTGVALHVGSGHPELGLDLGRLIRSLIVAACMFMFRSVVSRAFSVPDAAIKIPRRDP